MNGALLRALVASVPAGMLLAGSALSFLRGRRTATLLQLLGTCGIALVVLAHICEALHWFPAMRWGAEDSPGHYLDLVSAIFGFTLFPTGYLLQALWRRGS